MRKGKRRPRLRVRTRIYGWWMFTRWVWCHYVRHHPEAQLIEESNLWGCHVCVSVWGDG